MAALGLDYVFECGSLDPSTPSVFWLHGATESHHEFIQAVSFFPQDRYHHCLLDYAGHGVQSKRQFTLEAAQQDLEKAINERAHSGPIYIVGLSMGGMTTLTFLRTRTEFVRARVAKVFITGAGPPPTLKPPFQKVPFFALLVVPFINIFLAARTIPPLRRLMQRISGIHISDELARDLWKGARFCPMVKAAAELRKNYKQPGEMTPTDVRVMLCMGSKEFWKGIGAVHDGLEPKVTECRTVIALGQYHMYACFGR
jgi:pimeloyl-ACP methyl ester carboxylesterase